MRKQVNGENTVRMHFFYDAQGRPSIIRYNDVDYVYVHNLQGDVIAIVDMDGNKVVEYGYDAWGKPTGKTGTLAGTLGADNPFRYRGYVWDEETGLYSTTTRYYNPEWGRWLNADSLIGRVGGLFTHNAFEYCLSNPICYIDSDGTEPLRNTNRLLNTDSKKWGQNTEAMPASHLVANMVEIGDFGEEWKYELGAMTYKASDCNGAIRLSAQQYFDKSTYDGFNIRTINSQILDVNCYDQRPISSADDLNSLVPGMIIFSPSLNHVWLYLGEHNGVKHAVADVAHYNYGIGKQQNGAGFQDLANVITWEAFAVNGKSFTAAKLTFVSYPSPRRIPRRTPRPPRQWLWS